MPLLSTRIPVAVGAGLLACLGPAGPAGAGTACPPTAVLEGAAEIVTPIAAVLRRRGVGTGPSDCARIVRASLAPRPNLATYSLHIEDSYGRVSDREVADARTAASLIESWAIDEDADVLAPRATPAAVETLGAETKSAATPPPVTWRVDVLGEVATATDRSIWYGGTAAACGRVGPFCVGGRIRLARDAEAVVTAMATGIDGAISTAWTRTRYGGGAMVALPLSRGLFTLAPTIGLGLVQTRSVLNDVPVDVAEEVLSVSAEAGIGIAGALSEHWSLVADVSGALAYSVSSGTTGFSSSNFGETPWNFFPSPPRGLIGFGIGVRYAR
jgi:hypothetical protein